MENVRVKIVPVIASALGVIRKALDTRLRIRERHESVLTSVLMGAANIRKKVPER